MNKNILTGLAVSALAMMAVSSPVMANNAAVTITEFGCNMWDQYGNVTVSSESQSSVANSAGNTTLKCYATGVANDTGKAVRLSGQVCYTYLGVTTRMYQVIDTEGNATLTCQVKKAE